MIMISSRKAGSPLRYSCDRKCVHPTKEIQRQILVAQGATKLPAVKVGGFKKVRICNPAKKLQ